ncbi:NRDE family protein [Microbulbifer guangxiensis]|uniref:NRDE family protein n=1 Tax=Microbulbifer guangxiensis TaxID=2904249 RepID=UPI001F3D57AB|nr:NRDE family protein [Microbulbifer guangxiensis]
MCLLLFAYHCHPNYPLLMLANRDEFYHRPTEPAQAWPGAPMVAGRDLEGGGTWAGIAPGRVAAVTNIREPQIPSPPAPLSRGDIPRDFLQGQSSPLDFALSLDGDRYRGFNTLLFRLGATDELVCAGNRHQPFRFAPGVHGISNGAPDAPWPKVERGRTALAELLNGMAADLREDHFVDRALTLLRDQEPARPEELPHTGVGPELEKALSPIFVRIEQGNFPGSIAAAAPGPYGTRASTVIAVHRDGTTQLWEQGYRAGRPAGQVRQFTLSPP